MPLASGGRSAGDALWGIGRELAGRWNRGELLSAPPGAMGVLQDALMLGRMRLEDESGRVELGRDGSLSLRPKGQAWNLSLAPGQAAIGFDTRQREQDERSGLASGPLVIHGLDAHGPERPALSPARQLLEEEQYRYQRDNPDWWRPR